MVGTVSGRDGDIGSVSFHGRTDSCGKIDRKISRVEGAICGIFSIGTLLSIGLAVLGGLVLVKLWYGTMSLK